MNVGDLLKSILEGEIVLPDFQRELEWGPEDIRELLVSVLGDYFIGTFLILEYIKDDSPFALRFIKGVKKINPNIKMKSIVKILLDGQQRATALFYALYEPDVPLKGYKAPHRYYLDLDKYFNGEINDAVIVASLNDKRRLKEIEQNKSIIPFSLIKEIWENLDKVYPELVKRFEGDHEKIGKVIKLANEFKSREINVYKLPIDTEMQKIVETFERINRTGKPLSVFDLAVARLYKYDINLRNLLSKASKEYNFVKYVKPETILKVIAIIRGKDPKRKNILNLEPDDFESDWQKACDYLERAYKRITDLRDGYGVLDFRKWTPYSSMIVPLASILWFIKENDYESPANYAKVDAWYWISVFDRRYDQAVDTTSFEDYKKLKEWIQNDNPPDFVKSFKPNEIDLSVDRQSSAIYRGVMSLIVLEGALDFKTGQPPQFDPNKVQDDHIFPYSIFRENCVLNRTLITTNQSKFNKRPSEYFRERLEEHGREKLEEILKSHIIPPEALDYLLKDDLKNFMKCRREAIVEEIKRKVGITY